LPRKQKKETFSVLIRQLGYCFSARGKDQQGFIAGSSHFENILLRCHFLVDPLRGGIAVAPVNLSFSRPRIRFRI